jgi:succinate-acetate transporter protein
MGTPAVLYMVGAACFAVFALLFGLVTPGALPVVAVLLIAGGIATMILGTIELARGDILLGSIDMVFGGLIFLGVGFILGAASWWLTQTGELPDIRAAGYFAAGIALLFFLFLPSVGKVSWSLFLAFVVLGVGIAFLAWGLITGVHFGMFPMNISGICFLVFGLYTMYAGTVFITNTVHQAPKLGLGGPMF